MAFVIDSSAITKLIVEEQHSKVFWNWVNDCKSELLISELARTEVSRAIARINIDLHSQFNAIIGRFGVIRVSTQVLSIAAIINPPSLRTLDTIHLASCLMLGDDLTGFVTYDSALASAAQINNIDVIAPGIT